MLPLLISSMQTGICRSIPSQQHQILTTESFGFDDEDMELLNNISATCGYEEMMKQANTFPPSGVIAVPEILQLNNTDSTINYINNTACSTQLMVLMGKS